MCSCKLRGILQDETRKNSFFKGEKNNPTSNMASMPWDAIKAIFEVGGRREKNYWFVVWVPQKAEKGHFFCGLRGLQKPSTWKGGGCRG